MIFGDMPATKFQQALYRKEDKKGKPVKHGTQPVFRVNWKRLERNKYAASGRGDLGGRKA